jgi:putative addiction module killer protein
MISLQRTVEFDKWFKRLRDAAGKAKISIRLDRLAEGNPGNVRSVGEGVSELRIDFGPGYRVYYQQRGEQIILLVGGDKNSQKRDVRRAKALASQE